MFILKGKLGFCLLLFLIFLLSGCWPGNIKNSNHHDLNDLEKLANLSIEDLMNIEFVTVGKKAEKLFESAAAAVVITHEDVAKTGILTIPDALRMAPGLQVAQHNASNWAVAVRGFSGFSRGINGQFANKLLVMNDGRSVYTPLFSGVSWATQQMLLEDIERIEIVRGPGATLWGSNAVNGVINIISKPSPATQGVLFTLGGGSEYRAFGHFRYGGRINDYLHFRIYGKYFKADSQADSTGASAHDDWRIRHGGFRMDWEGSPKHTLTLQGDIYDGKAGQTYLQVNSLAPPYKNRFQFDDAFSGGNILSRWSHRSNRDSEFQLQVYFDRWRRREAAVRGAINTIDIDFQHTFPWRSNQEIIWGGGYRFIADDFDSTLAFWLQPESRHVNLFNAFFQNEISFMRHRFKLIIGSKLEHNTYSGLELQPNLRLQWAPNTKHTAWAAVSRAVRTPSRAENDARIISNLLSDDPMIPIFEIQSGDHSVDSEKLTAVEAGYRVRPGAHLSFDIATFLNIYDNLRVLREGMLYLDNRAGQNVFVFPLFVDNGGDAAAFGFELSGSFAPTPKLKFDASYSYLEIDMKAEMTSGQAEAKVVENQSPKHQVFVRTNFEPVKNLTLDLRLRYIDELPSLQLERYINGDLHLGWQMNNHVGFSVVIHNFFHKRIPESSLSTSGVSAPNIQSGTEASEIQRGVYSKLTWQF